MKYKLFFICAFIMSTCANSIDSTTNVVEKLKVAIKFNYVLEHKTDAINNDLSKLIRNSDFMALHNQQDIANSLSKILQRHDKHFSVQVLTPSDKNRAIDTRESWFTRLKRKNSGIKRVEVLEGNIGFIEMEGFDEVNDTSRRIVGYAMHFIAQTSAVIIDLRANGGGSPEMVQLVSSYFLPADTHLNTFYNRPSQTRLDFQTKDELEPHFNREVPLYILIGKNTFSAAEEFAYNLKHLKRATVVGEPSKGGAHPWQWFSLSPDIRVAIPVSMAINPVTKTNWEGKGVIPTIRTEEGNALIQAYNNLLQWRVEDENNAFELEEILQVLDALNGNESVNTNLKSE